MLRDAGWGHCDTDNNNGCEANLKTSVAHCGTCTNDCAQLANVASVTCEAGTCKVVSCQPGFVDCDGVASNGCEVNLSTHCCTDAHCTLANQKCSGPGEQCMCKEGKSSGCMRCAREPGPPGALPALSGWHASQRC